MLLAIGALLNNSKVFSPPSGKRIDSHAALPAGTQTFKNIHYHDCIGRIRVSSEIMPFVLSLFSGDSTQNRICSHGCLLPSKVRVLSHLPKSCGFQNDLEMPMSLGHIRES